MIRRHVRFPASALLFRRQRGAAFKLWLWAVLFFLAAAAGCNSPSSLSEPPYLLRVGEEVVTVLDYKKAVELAKAAYPHSALQHPETVRAIKLRVLREMTEALILRQRARELGLSVSETEVDQAEKAIRDDYPEGTFEETLLENAVSYADWREQLKSRLLNQKVIAQDLESRIQISAKDVADYYRDHRGDLTEAFKTDGDTAQKRVDEQIVEDLRRKKAEAAYAGWIDSLRKKYLIDINASEWQRLAKS
ncbi:MAG: SurA N-terminal domain-containing protein [Desulfobacterales bacterium]